MLRTSLDALPELSELIVVHNARTSSEDLQQLCETVGARYLHEPVPGLSVARNRAIIEARGEVVAFVDDDIVVAPEWAVRLVERFRDEDLQVVTGRITPSPGGNPAGLQWAEIYGTQPSEAIAFTQASDFPFFPLTAGMCGLGGNMAFRSSFLLRHGFFDPHFGLGSLLPGADENDRFYAVLREGKKILFAPDVCVEHVYADDAGGLRAKVEGYAASQVAFVIKCFLHDPPMRPVVARYVIARIAALLKHSKKTQVPSPPKAPRGALIRGSLWGPFAYAWSLVREAAWPSRTVIVTAPDERSERHASPSILMMFYNSGLSGAPRISRSLAALLRDRLQVTAVLPGASETTDWLHRAGIKVGIVPRERVRATLNPLPHLKYLIKFPGIVAAYRRTIRRVQPDVVHVDSLLNLPALVAGRSCNVKTVLHLQEVPLGLSGRLLAYAAGLLAHRIVAVSRTAAQRLTTGGSQKVTVVHNGTRPAYAGSWDPYGYISFFGRLSEDKDPLSFVRAAAAVYEREPSARFLICGLTVPGRKQYEARLARLIARTGIPKDHFRVVKGVHDISELLAQSSVVVACCLVESFGLSILEAMAAGKPVVVPRSGAFPEYITDMETGLFYSPGNVAELADCIVRLLRDPNLARRIGEAARALATSRFTDTRMADEFMEQYRILLGQPADAATIGSHG